MQQGRGHTWRTMARGLQEDEMKKILLAALTAGILAIPATPAAASVCVGLPGPSPLDPEVCVNGGDGQVCVDKYEPATCVIWT